MFVRVLTLDGIDPGTADEIRETARERTLPLVQQLKGYRGMVGMIDRQGRRLRNAVFFDSEEDIRAAESTFETLPQRFPEDAREAIRAAQRTVDVFEVVAEDRISFG